MEAPRLSICSALSTNLNNYIETTSLSSSLITPSGNPQFKVSKRRWAILFAIWLFIAAGALCDSLNTILHTLLDLLEIPLDKFLYISLFFAYLPVATSVPTAWFIDRYGVRITMYIGVFLAIPKYTLKAFLFNPSLPGWKRFKFMYWFLTNAIGQQVMVIVSVIPLKISESWFPTNERSTAWSIMTSASTVGYSIATFTYARIVQKVDDVLPLFWVNIASGVVTTIAVLVCITKSKPKYPPSERNAISSMKKTSAPFFQTLKKVICHKDMMLHLLLDSCCDGVYWAVITVQQDILIASGHSELFVGNSMTIFAISHLVSQILLSPFVHRIKNKVLACKIAAALRSLLLVLFLASMLRPLDERIILAAGIVFSFSRGWASPNLTNLTAQMACGYISMATISSFFMVSTTIFHTLTQIIFASLVVNNAHAKSDYTLSSAILGLIILLTTILYALLFRGRAPKYVRMIENETGAPEEE